MKTITSSKNTHSAPGVGPLTGPASGPSAGRSANGSANQSGVGQRLMLERLVDELIKHNPDQEIVRTQMMAAGLKYSNDPITSMSVVLQALEDSKFISSDRLPREGEQMRVQDSIENELRTSAPQAAKNSSSKTKRTSNASKRRERDNVQDL